MTEMCPAAALFNLDKVVHRERRDPVCIALCAPTFNKNQKVQKKICFVYFLRRAIHELVFGYGTVSRGALVPCVS